MKLTALISIETIGHLGSEIESQTFIHAHPNLENSHALWYEHNKKDQTNLKNKNNRILILLTSKETYNTKVIIFSSLQMVTILEYTHAPTFFHMG